MSRQADRFWAITAEVAKEAQRRRTPASRIATLGPLLYPVYHQAEPAPPVVDGRPQLVLGTGGNGANIH